MRDIHHALMLNQNIIDEKKLITLKKKIIERLSQTINIFSNV